MADVLGIGDAVVDIYRDRTTAYPGGNALNVAAYSRLFYGSRAGFAGILGTDGYGDHVADTLSGLGVDVSRIRRAVGETGRTLVDLAADGDRVFLASNRGGVQHDVRLRLTDEDMELAGEFAAVHTSIDSGIEPYLPQLALQSTVSYDFSERSYKPMDMTLLPHVECAFVSASGWSPAERTEFARACFAHGATVLVLTAGAAGAHGYTSDGEFYAPIHTVEAVDALGAGDGFITGFLHSWTAAHDPVAALAAGAAAGARACGYRGAFDCGTPAGTADMDIMLATNPHVPQGGAGSAAL